MWNIWVAGTGVSTRRVENARVNMPVVKPDYEMISMDSVILLLFSYTGPAWQLCDVTW